MERTFQGYLDFLERLGQTLEELTDLTREKARAAGQGDLKGLDAAMRREQALSLSLRGMEQQREDFLRGLGLAGTSLSDLPEHAPEPLRPAAKRTVEDVRRKYALYRSASEAARTILECELHRVAAHMDQPPGETGPGRPLADIRA